MAETQFEIQERHHADVLRQMRIGNIASGIIATASLFALVTVLVKAFK